MVFTQPMVQNSFIVANSFPHSIYEVGAGIKFNQMDDNFFSRLYEDGFKAVKLPPIHPVSTTLYRGMNEEVKQGSAYSIKSLFEIGPYHFRDHVTIDGYLAKHGGISRNLENNGWIKLSEVAERAKKHDIQLIADLVLAHVDRDPKVIASYTDLFGVDIFLHSVSDEDKVGGISQFGVKQWFDTMPFNFASAAAVNLGRYQLGIIDVFQRHGVNLFRIDAAWRLLTNNYLGNLISKAKSRGFPKPLFLGEVLGRDLSEIDAAFLQGIDIAPDSLHWWDYESEWYENVHNFLCKQLRGTLSSSSNCDTQNLAKEDFLIRTALAALIASSYVITEGSHVGKIPSVFLSKIKPRDDLYIGGGIYDPTRAFYRALNRFKLEPIFKKQIPIKVSVENGLTYIRKQDPNSGQQAMLIINKLGRARQDVLIPEGYYWGFSVYGERFLDGLDLSALSDRKFTLPFNLIGVYN